MDRKQCAEVTDKEVLEVGAFEHTAQSIAQQLRSVSCRSTFADAAECGGEAFREHRLEEVIERAQLECRHCIRVVRGDENEGNVTVDLPCQLYAPTSLEGECRVARDPERSR